MSFNRIIIFTLIFVTRILFFCGDSVASIHSCSAFDLISDGKMLTASSELYATTLIAVRKLISVKVYGYLKAPYAQLLLGMVVGIDDFNKIFYFKQLLQNTGTIHVVVVSGYNISVVSSMLLVFLGKKASKLKVMICLICTLLYALLAGFEPPVVRAWLMCSLVLIARFLGRSINILEILILSALIMLLIDPSYLYSVSFQLSFMATLSLIYYGDILNNIFKPKNILYKDFISSLAAQVLVWPLIAYYFNQVSILSPLINALILWTVPIATVLGGVFVASMFINFYIASVLSIIVQVPLSIFVYVVEAFSELDIGLYFVVFSPKLYILYYLVVLLLPKFIAVVRKQ